MPDGLHTDENGLREDLYGEVVEDAPATDPACTLITGPAGVGKTYQVLQRIAADPQWAILSSTTGISSVNLGCTTINSLLGYYDEDSLRDCYLTGRLATKLRALRSGTDGGPGVRNLLVEECSMLTAPALDMLWRGCSESGGAARLPLGIVLVGDFMQLPPVRGRWAFEADCWPRFAAATERLEKVWRQTDAGFLRALGMCRAGEGEGAARQLTALGAQWHTALDTEFDGTTIVPKNDMVDRFNAIALARVQGRVFTVGARRWGRERSEWKLIPPRLELKVGAYVMLLANAPDGMGGFQYVNGDCGHVRDYVMGGRGVSVELVRTGRVVTVYPLVRDCDQKERPEGAPKDKEEGYVARPHRNIRGRWVEGQIEFYPLRTAYASTVHKTQSLSLDRVQIDFRHGFFKAYAMLYTAMSRARTLGGLRLVGQPEIFARHCNTDPAVRNFL